MATRRKFSDIKVYLPDPVFETLARGAARHGLPWHVAYAELERRVAAEVERLAQQVIEAWATDDNG